MTFLASHPRLTVAAALALVAVSVGWLWWDHRHPLDDVAAVITIRPIGGQHA